METPQPKEKGTNGETHAALPTIYATAEEILQALNQTAKAAESVLPPEEQAGYTQND